MVRASILCAFAAGLATVMAAPLNPQPRQAPAAAAVRKAQPTPAVEEAPHKEKVYQFDGKHTLTKKAFTSRCCSPRCAVIPFHHRACVGRRQDRWRW